MKLVFVFLVAFCAVQCFGASIANYRESNKLYEDNQKACVLKALDEAKKAVKEGKEQCDKDKKCLIKLAIRVSVNLWNDLKKCRNNMFGETRIIDQDILSIMNEIIFIFGGQLPKELADLVEQYKKILNADSEEEKSICFQQKRDDMYILGQKVIADITVCTWGDDYEKCIVDHMLTYPMKQEKILEEYEECLKKNL